MYSGVSLQLFAFPWWLITLSILSCLMTTRISFFGKYCCNFIFLPFKFVFSLLWVIIFFKPTLDIYPLLHLSLTIIILTLWNTLAFPWYCIWKSYFKFLFKQMCQFFSCLGSNETFAYIMGMDFWSMFTPWKLVFVGFTFRSSVNLTKLYCMLIMSTYR